MPCRPEDLPAGRSALDLFTNAVVTNLPDDRAYTVPSEDVALSFDRKRTGQNFLSGFLLQKRVSSAHLRACSELYLRELDTRSPILAPA